jgi:UDP-glucose 4-epimerase
MRRPGRVLVTGGAGYIGAVVVEELWTAGAEAVVVLDDLSKGHAAAVRAPTELVRGDIGDATLVLRVCREAAIDAVVHMAASSLVGESVESPAAYYRNNVAKGLALLDAMVVAGVRRLVFSSTAAVYGCSSSSPIDEDSPIAPTNPYGETKVAFERALTWYARAYGLRFATLRYFNAAGATDHCGESHAPETHLIPIVLEVARGLRDHVPILGDAYPTFDGTCVRDYVHVSDLARAHVLALGGLDGHERLVCNLGNGRGFSVRQVIEAAREVTGLPIDAHVHPARAGDPAVLVASSERIRRILDWQPRKPDLRSIIGDAWTWSRNHPDGFSASPTW